MAWYEIPLDTTPDQEFSVTVSVGDENIPLILHLRYNTEGEYWRMDISNKTGKMLIAIVPMLTGQGMSCDILRQFGYMGIGSAIILPVTDERDSDSPNIINLGTDFVLIWGKEDEA